MEVSPSMSDLFYHHQQQQQQQQHQQQAQMAAAYLERMAFPFGYPQYPIYPSFRGDDYGRRRGVLPLVRFDPMNGDFPPEARPRSGSLGSTASSLRDGPSPSFDSVTGGSGSIDSVSSRDSPFSFTSSSPSPSPLSPPTPGPSSTDGGSKLRRVLLGTLSSPYSVLCRRVCPSPRDAGAEPNCTTPPTQRKRKYDSVQTTPMDLSCKRPCSGRPANRPCSDDEPRKTASPAARTSTEDAGHPSILKAILCGRHADADRRVGGVGAVPSTTTTTNSAMSSAGRHSPCCPAAATATANSCSSTNALPVTLAKKNLLPVSARVLDWLLRTVRFARALPQFARLSHHDKVALLLNSWSRVLLLYMAETDFEFAVTAVPCGCTGGGGGDASAPSPAPPTPPEGASVDGEVPTMNSVEGIQRFIRKCQALNLDSTEYEYMRMATIFHRGKTSFLCDVTIRFVFIFSLHPSILLSLSPCTQKLSIQFY